jgi:hypothetical protein
MAPKKTIKDLAKKVDSKKAGQIKGGAKLNIRAGSK